MRIHQPRQHHAAVGVDLLDRLAGHERANVRLGADRGDHAVAHQDGTADDEARIGEGGATFRSAAGRHRHDLRGVPDQRRGHARVLTAGA